MTAVGSARPRVLVTADFSDAGLDRLREFCEVRQDGWGVTGRVVGEEETIDLLQGVDILIPGYEPITERVLGATSLRLIASIRGGPEANVDLAAAARRGIPVTGTAGREAIPVADFTFGLILAIARHIVVAAGLLRSGSIKPNPAAEGDDLGWGMGPLDPWNALKGIELSGKVLGLVGLGAVGREVARRGLGFGMRVVAFDPHALPMDSVTLCSLDEVVSQADILSVHARLTHGSRSILGERELRLLKPSAYLINTARADIIDRQALLEALREERLAGAALDVHHTEPLDPGDPFFGLDNVLMTPHIAGATVEVKDRHSNQVIDSVLQFLRGEPLTNDVTTDLARAAHPASHSA